MTHSPDKTAGHSDGGAGGTRTHDLTDYEAVITGCTKRLPGQTLATSAYPWA
jgi:hypothetical protein